MLLSVIAGQTMQNPFLYFRVIPANAVFALFKDKLRRIPDIGECS